MKYYSVDRIEGDRVVLVGDDLDLVMVLSQLPTGVREGNVLRQEGDTYFLDPEEEERRRQRIYALQQKLLNKNR